MMRHETAFAQTTMRARRVLAKVLTASVILGLALVNVLAVVVRV